MTEFCDEALTEVYLYLDRELTWWRRRKIRHHLAECSPCGRSYDFERRLKIVIRSRLAEDVPQQFIDRLNQALQNERELGKR